MMKPDELLELFSTPAALAATETGEPDEYSIEPEPMTRSVWEFRSEFDAFIGSLNLSYFTAREFLVKGGSNQSGSCAGKNTDPPRSLWSNMTHTARVIDRLRGELGYSLSITSAYRSSSYNTCIGAAGASQHMRFNALDFQGSQGSPTAWATALRRLRDSGVFHGGIGVYQTFVHVDTRGNNADW